jgi:hypothetical protein
MAIEAAGLLLLFFQDFFGGKVDLTVEQVKEG